MIGFYNYTVVLTYIGFVFGITGFFAAMSGYSHVAVIFLMLSGLCDGFDGTIANRRKRNDHERNFGIQIDSLSDLVCFGALPVVIGYSFGFQELWCIVIFCLYVLAALIRLAYFNVMEEERQLKEDGPRRYFEGLPVTSAAFIVPAVYLINKFLTEVIDIDVFKYLFCGFILLTAAAFIIKIKTPKPYTVKRKIFIGLVWAALFAGVIIV